MGKKRRASHRISPFFPFLTNLEDEIIFKGGRVCNTQIVRESIKEKKNNSFIYMCEFYLYASSHVNTLLKKHN
jgi:hypothetical protein